MSSGIKAALALFSISVNLNPLLLLLCSLEAKPEFSIFFHAFKIKKGLFWRGVLWEFSYKTLLLFNLEY
ncbi:hypothetical protein CsSME_00053964 [Camellia sinensis var. sinensis]